MAVKAIELRNVKYKYPRTEHWVLNGLDLDIRKNSLVILAGSTGSGKSTLLRLIRGLQKEYGGKQEGIIRIFGNNTEEYSSSQLGSIIAIVFQNPAYQLHQPRVIDEIMSAPIYQALPWSDCVERAEISADLVMLGDFLDRNPTELSVGEQQKIALAASLAMKADILLLDEPFAYLDAKAAEDFLQVIKKLKINGKTIVLATHDLGTVAEIADEIVLLHNGKVVVRGLPSEVLYSEDIHSSIGRPLFVTIGEKLVRAGRIKRPPTCWKEIANNLNLDSPKVNEEFSFSKKDDDFRKTAVELVGVSYSYPESKFGIKDISLKIEEGEIFGIIGSNGSGKSTLAKIMLGLIRPNKGKVKVLGNCIKNIYDVASDIGYVTQNPSAMLFETSVTKECSFGPLAFGKDNPMERVNSVLSKLGLIKYSERDPHSLSGGEQRLLSLATVLVNDPSILLLDEPEFGLDTKNRRSLMHIIQTLQREGKTIILISHDLELAAFMCNRIAILKEGKLIKSAYLKEIIFDKNVLINADLKYPALFSVLDFVGRRTSKDIFTEQDFINAISSDVR